MGKRMIDWSVPEEEGQTSRFERRRAGRDQADDATVLTDRLMNLPEPVLGQLPLDPDAMALLRDARSKRPDNGQRRTIRRLAGAIRASDRRSLHAALELIDAGKSALDAALHRWEKWRDRLIAEGEPALQALAAERANLPLGQLRTLMNEARAEQGQGGPPKAARALFKALRALGE